MTLEQQAWHLWEIKQYEQALPLLHQLYSEATDQESKIEILDAIAHCFVETKQYDKAMDTYNKVLELAPNDADILANIANVLVRQRKIPEAIDFYQKSLDDDNTNKDDMFRLAQLYYRQKNVEQALGTWNEILVHYPDEPRAYEAIGFIEAERHNYANSLPAYQRALILDNENYPLAKNLIVLMLNMGNLSSAKKSIELLIHNEIEDADLLYYLALIESQTGDKESAIGHLKDALAMQPSLLSAQELLKQLQ